MKQKLSDLITCGYCHNVAKMEIAGDVWRNETPSYETDPSDPFDTGPPEEGTTYSVVICPKCSKVNIVSCYWHELMEDEGIPIRYEHIYPTPKEQPKGLPPAIQKEWALAELVRSLDPNLYAIQVRKVLELVCLDKGATEKMLGPMLKELSISGAIPNALVKVAEGVKNFGNIGSHPEKGDLSENEIPLVNALARAILEYLYTAPHLIAVAEAKLLELQRLKSSP